MGSTAIKAENLFICSRKIQGFDLIDKERMLIFGHHRKVLVEIPNDRNIINQIKNDKFCYKCGNMKNCLEIPIPQNKFSKYSI